MQAKTSAEPRPFLKWVGGKRQLLATLRARVPELGKGTYHEPFVGGGALFFALRPKKAVLTDTNQRLVRTYIGVRDHVDEVIKLLRRFPHDPAFFQKMRERDIDKESVAEIAAWMIYLNKTGYNGLYRVNSRNQFNVPFGRYANPKICDEPNLRACSSALQGVKVEHDDFAGVLGRARKGDFVYFDPPYVPLSATSYFTSYTADGFGAEQQERLRDVAKELKRKGVRVLLSNSSAGFVRALYADGFSMEEVEASRNVNCRGDGRGRILELVMW